jgi:hypothetical protein
MAQATEHIAAATAVGTGLMTFFHILPETLGCILSACGIVWYVLQIISHIRREKITRETHRRRQADQKEL